MKVLVFGGGGREHALVWKLRQSPRVSKIYCAPGNGGIMDDAECVPADLKNLQSMVSLAEQLRPDLTVVGPELPLTLGIVDELQSRKLPVFGPRKRAAQLESSKSFAKAFLQRHRVFPILVATERLDAVACRAIEKEIPGAPVFTSDEFDMFELVSILRTCAYMVSSRYHGIVTSMPAGVASAGVGGVVGAGWPGAG